MSEYINEPGHSFLAAFLNKNYSGVIQYMRSINNICSYKDLAQIIYYMPYIIRYYDKLMHSKSIYITRILGSFNDTQRSFLSKAEVLEFLKNKICSFEIQTSSISIKYKYLTQFIGHSPIESNRQFFIVFYLTRYTGYYIDIGNIRFKSFSPAVDTIYNMIEWFRRYFGLIHYTDREAVLDLEKGSGYLFMCAVLGISPLELKDKKPGVIRTMVYDFLRITQYQIKEQIKALRVFRKVIVQPHYCRFHTWNEIRSYKKYLNAIRKRIKDDIDDDFEQYEKYKLTDVPDTEHNKYKLTVELNSDEHPDYQYFKFIVKKYFRWHNLYGILRSNLNNIFKIIEKNALSRKLIYLRTVFKDCASPYNEMWKNHGYILLYNFEILLGYRMDSLKVEELEDQVKKNFFSNNEVNGTIQKEFFEKYFYTAVHAQIGNYNSMADVASNNCQKNFGKSMYYNKHIFFDANGATHEKIRDKNGRNHNMTKSQFFSAVQDVDKYIEGNSLGFRDYSSIVVKRETVKDRIVVNTSLNTYIPLCKIEYLLHKFLKNSFYCYSLNSVDNKNLLYGRLLQYCTYNKYKRRKYVLLPLDYSNYDTTITFDLIETTLLHFGSLTPYSSEIKQLVNIFKQLQFTEEIRFKELKTTYNYRYGVLSGWKITNLVESLLNFVISYGVCRELNYDLVDIITMGDDLVLVLDCENLDSEGLKKILQAISDKYQTLGFNVHPIKNMCGYECIEFLRNYYNGLGVVTYPIRSLTSVVYTQPTSELEYNNYTNYKNTLDKLIIKNGLYFISEKIYSLMDLSSNTNIKQYGYKYCCNPDMFNLKHSFVYEYQINDDFLIRNSQLYNHYVNVFGKKYDAVIYSYVKNAVFSKRVSFEKIEQRRRRYNFNKKTEKYLSAVKNYFLNIIGYSKLPDYVFNVGDYHVNVIASTIMDNDMAVVAVLHRLIDSSESELSRKIAMHEGLDHLTKSNRKFVLDGFKLTIVNSLYNSAMVKPIKEQFYRFVIYNRLITRKIAVDKHVSILVNNILSSLYRELSSIYIITVNQERIPLYVAVD